jgi:hypothetical protein
MNFLKLAQLLLVVFALVNLKECDARLYLNVLCYPQFQD